MHDIIIIGGGPAGLTAALYALRADKTVLIIEKNSMGGQIATSPRVENYPGVMSVSGIELADNLLSQVMDRGGEIELAEVTGISDAGDKKIVHSKDGDFEGKAIILATGARHRQLGVPLEAELTGKGVSYCAVCDGAFFKGKPVAVVGGGNAAIQDALILSATSSEVYIIHRRGDFTAEAVNVKKALSRPNIKPIMNTKVAELIADDDLTGIVTENLADGSRKNISVDGLFVAVGFEAENESFRNVARLDKSGWFASGEDCHTNTPGIFAAGDCRVKDVRQLATAVGDGAIAAIAACRFIDSLSK